MTSRMTALAEQPRDVGDVLRRVLQTRARQTTHVSDLDTAARNRAKVEKALARMYVSPLRYPGGKRKLVAHVADFLGRQGLTQVDRVIEPFAGGASVSIALLEAGVAQQAVLNDIDPLIAAFWKTVFSRKAGELVDRILSAEVTLGTWEALRSSEPRCELERAFKCLFLNRTSFSGSLQSAAGPIGGKAQTGAYRIDCRWNPERLANRISELSALAPRVEVRCSDFKRFIGSYKASHTRRPTTETLWYLDPPFFHKADKLYRYCFDDADHRTLRKTVLSLNGTWMLSYDNCAESRSMYSDCKARSFVDMRYTAAKRGVVQRLDCTELVVTSS